MNNNPIVSLCIPTNGVIEWVFPVLDSIYKQEINENKYEVVIADNGKNLDFKKEIKNYIKKHSNLVYAETQALPFLNEIETYKIAKGRLIKFVNHRTKLIEGAIQKLTDFTLENEKNKPVVYFSNGAIKTLKQSVYEFNNFDSFVKNLSYWSSWSTGMTIWKDDFDRLSDNISDYNELFPHTTILFNERERGTYIIDNIPIMEEMPQGRRPKGRYDLFGAFGIEYMSIILDLFRDGSISIDTFRFVKDRNLEFISQLYLKYCIRKFYCSYDLSGLNTIFGVFYSRKDLYLGTLKTVFMAMANKISNKLIKSKES